MPIETTRTVTATSPHSPKELLAILQAEVKTRLQAAAFKSGDVARVTDGDLERTAMLLSPIGVVLAYHPEDKVTTLLVHNADGMELPLRLMPAQIERAS
ncbi:hypothetical protein [uncultured Enterovirga sp.]|uniref:hypothetical protein n=1 Tax=uncultured Enterovirga sp. TaxID=2026352 RepID=UPI0035CC0D13